MSKLTKAQQVETAEAAARLRELLPPGSTVYTVLRHVSRSGMMRHIDCYTIKDGEHIYLSGYVDKLLRWGRTEDGAIKATGAGMDMGFHVVYSLSFDLYPDGFTCPGESCPRCYGRQGKDQGDEHRDGGYALKQRWI